MKIEYPRNTQIFYVNIRVAIPTFFFTKMKDNGNCLTFYVLLKLNSLGCEKCRLLKLNSLGCEISFLGYLFKNYFIVVTGQNCLEFRYLAIEIVILGHVKTVLGLFFKIGFMTSSALLY